MAAMNIVEHVSLLHVRASSGYMPRSGIAYLFLFYVGWVFFPLYVCLFEGVLYGRLFVCLFFKIYLFNVYEYTVAVFRHTRRGHRIPLQMVVSHYVVTGN